MKKLYKIVATLLALAVIPVTLFVPFFKIVVTSNLGSLGGSSVLLDESYSLYEIYDSFLKGNEEREALDIKTLLSGVPDDAKDELGPSFIAFLILFILVVLTALVLLILILATKKKQIIWIVAGLGVLFTIGMNFFFNRFAAPLISGVVPLLGLVPAELMSQFMGGSGLLAGLGGILGSLLGGTNVVQVYALSLSTAYLLILLLYIASLVLAVINSIKDN